MCFSEQKPVTPHTTHPNVIFVCLWVVFAFKQSLCIIFAFYALFTSIHRQ